MNYIVAYKQLKSQLQRVLGTDARCMAFDYSLEDGDSSDDVKFPNTEELTIVCGNDIRSRLLLCLAAKKYHGKIYYVELVGEFTEYAPLAVSDEELKECSDKARLMCEPQRNKLIQEYNSLPSSNFWQLQDNRIVPLSWQVVEHHILKHLSAPMSIPIAVGLCMGNAPYGWPRTDTFYYNQIGRLCKSGKLKVLHSDILQ